MSSKQVVNQEKQVPANVLNTAWGTESVDVQDMIIPKLLLMQGLSVAVADGDAQMGDILDSLTLEKLGSGREKDLKAVEVIPIYSYKTWVVYEKLGGDKIEYKEIVEWGPDNSNWERDTDEWRRDLVLNFYVMLKDQIEDPTAIPYLVSFRRTSYQAGKKLATHFFKCAKAGLPPARTVFELTAKKVSNDQGTWYTWDVTPKEEAKETWVNNAYEWYLTVQKGDHKVDDSDLVDPVATKSAPVVDEESVEY